ncbi:tRNA (adenosine(37)-N6)-threonylcarbamoyltransferase complex dimerization subunit type 1 TsaB [Rhodoferax lacus]|uniref:tRNA (Adenosine(37)-N6)-threonylcarbamoyltransferase complex dimerization subunit type 1 TsaB n=1 Tax=Rhodoferax lacus TaxID=2184758 RepID=A0A3E1RAN1_9BURK|nr:tRNA (adenosine(37)-N6)-threonylcarbamoyltransferase complex dimerization subunit type 1 TsaB [Rhodoferax lacus]RFO96281.1 tRNA (adenosine(37)-N6)-threonylcarbamoyltransferase complex dimerization subunit type 1 TsaB [Rhodoferax lacus]
MKLLAFDTSTDAMSIAVSRDDGAAAGLWQHQGEGGARASAGLIAAVLELMRQSGLRLSELDAICFGCGPGSFTGLRTACAVAQGLAFGAGVPVLPVNSLLALAEEARHSGLQQVDNGEVTALLDARMEEIYVARYAFAGSTWTELQAAHLLRPEYVVVPTGSLPQAAAGNAFAVYGPRLGGIADGVTRITALPQATALLRLAPQLLARGLAVPAAQALPTYVRDKVAQTTAERAAIKAAQVATTIAP